MTIAVVGGGVTGLAVAHLLIERGASVTLFEADEREGGLGGSFRRDGFTFDFGPHEFCTDNPALKELLSDVCGDDLFTVQKRAAQYFRGRYLLYPFSIADVLANVGPLFCGRVLVEVLAARAGRLFRPSRDDSFESWTRARWGRTLYESYFGPYTKKVWGIDPDRLDPRTASQRITADSIWDLARRVLAYRLLGSEDHRRTHSEFRRSFLYVRRGIGSLLAHLRRRVEERGGRFEFSRRLVGVERAADGTIRGLGFADGTRVGGFSHVVSTIPLPELVRLARPDVGPELVRQNALPFRGLIFVFLRIARPQVLDFHWTYYPDAEIPFQRATEFVHFRADMSPPGTTGIALEIASTPGDGVWEAPDAQVVKDCVDCMVGLGQVRADEILGADVVRVRHGYPLQVMRYIEKAARLVDALREVPNLVTLGRQGLFRYCNMNECIEMAMDVAPRIIAGETSIVYGRPSDWKGVQLTDDVGAAARVQRG